MTPDQEPGASRRDVLRHASIATGALFVGVPAVSGIASGRRGRGRGRGVGGSGFLGNNGLSKVQSWPTFVVVGALDGSVDDPITGKRAFELEQAPDCTDDQPKTYQGYRVRAVSGDPMSGADNAILYVNPNRNVNTGVPAELTDVVDGCTGDVYIDGAIHGTYDTNKVSFGSA